MVELIKPSCQAKAGVQKLIFILKRSLNSFIRFYIRNTSVLALKISKRGVGVYFGTPCYGYALNCLSICLVIQGTSSLFKRKQKLFILFTCNLEK